MPMGPGKYDDLATQVREGSHADAVVIIVLGGDKGSGFSVQTASLTVLAKLPMLLRQLADGIERESSM